MNVLALSFKLEPKPENLKHVTKSHVRFIIHLALAAEGYIWGPGIILL